VTLGSDEVYLLVNETMRYRITRYWLNGDYAGQTDIFIDNLSYNGEGLFWLAMVYPRDQ
jgi:sugar lactone lactonase YvrE